MSIPEHRETLQMSQKVKIKKNGKSKGFKRKKRRK